MSMKYSPLNIFQATVVFPNETKEGVQWMWIIKNEKVDDIMHFYASYWVIFYINFLQSEADVHEICCHALEQHCRFVV